MDAKQKLIGIIYMARAIEKEISSLRNVYKDDKGNLDEASLKIADVIDDLTGHLTAVEKGVE